MEERGDLRSVLPLLPLVMRDSSHSWPRRVLEALKAKSTGPELSLSWPRRVLEALKAMSRGPEFSGLSNGHVLFDAIADLRKQLGFSDDNLATDSGHGYSLFFDDLMSGEESIKWFGETLPSMACLLMHLPSLLEAHYRDCDKSREIEERGLPIGTGLRVLESQEAGMVVLSQELIGALLACSFFCLFPSIGRSFRNLPTINFDYLFVSIHNSYSPSQKHKIKCLVHYFERICSCMPMGFVSFERKVLPLNGSSLHISYPKTDFWSKSIVELCPFKVLHSGVIEDQPYEALEVDFANQYFGGGALHRGCVQEEIRFMINPELIVGMLFAPRMEDNEALEIVGAERFCNYRGYASTFVFSGNYVDHKPLDIRGRRRTRIVAIDALCHPGIQQYGTDCLLRETNKAFCGFMDHSKCHQYMNIFKEGKLQDLDNGAHAAISKTEDDSGIKARNCSDREAEATACSTSTTAMNRSTQVTDLFEEAKLKNDQGLNCCENVGIATGNWGCGAFGGDHELKSMIQWLAASQALRPFLVYYTVGDKATKRLEQVQEWISSHYWTVGDLWNMMVEYSSQRYQGTTNIGFFDWLLPCL
ncbi:hypothetical protein AMTRI_Chr06g178920 [Amborella trichopoda]